VKFPFQKKYSFSAYKKQQQRFVTETLFGWLLLEAGASLL